MLRLLLIIIFDLALLSTYSQTSDVNNVDSCVSDYFIKYYTSPGHSIEPGFSVIDNNTLITCGSVILNNPNDYLDGYLTKTDANGKIVWQKTFGGIGTQGLRKLMKLADGNFVVSGVDATTTNIQYFLMKFDTNGTVIWRKDFGTTNSIENFSLSNIVEDINGDLVITAYNIENDPFAHYRILYARFDKLGNVLLSRFYVPPYEAFGAIMSPNSCIIKDGYTYIAGHVAINSIDGLLMKIDNTSGELKWAKIYDFNNGEADFSQVFNYSSTQLCLIGVNKLNPVDTSIIYLVDTSGVPSSVKYFQFPNLSNSEHRVYGIARLDDEKNLVWTMKNVSTLMSNLTISKVSPVDGVKWAKNYKQLSNMPRPTSILSGPDNSIFTGGYIVNATGNLEYYLARFSKDGESGCVPDNLQTSFGNGFSNFKDVTFTLEKNKSLIQKSGSNNLIGNYLQLTDSSCMFSNVCTKLKLSGPGTLCNIADTIQLQVTKNIECSLTPNLEFDTMKLKLLSFSGPIAKFIALKPGSVLVKAGLHTSCEVFEDSVSINIATAASVLDLGKDTTICVGNKLSLSAGQQFHSYKWQNGSTDSFFIATVPGKYFVTVTDYCGSSKSDTITLLPAAVVSLDFLPFYSKCGVDTILLPTPPQISNISFEPTSNIKYDNDEIIAWPDKDVIYSVKAITDQGCVVTDSFQINIKVPIALFLSNDTTICEGSTLKIKAPDGLKDYTWSSGSHLKEMNVTDAGTFWLEVVDTNGCSSRDTIFVSMNPRPAVLLGKDTTICWKERFTLKPGNNFVTYLWQDGTGSISYTTDNPGAYWVRVTDDKGCINADTINILNHLPVSSNILKEVDSICIFNPKIIYPAGNWSDYLWSNGMRTPSITVTNPGSYSLQVTNSSGCSAKDTIQILSYECIKGIWFPSAFSPNDDGKNDLFKPIVHTPISEYNLKIYNRYGQLIFQETSPARGWDGMFKFEKQNTGAYMWYCEYRLQGDEKKKQKGMVVLVR